MRYRRADVAGGTYFFTVNLAEWQSDLLAMVGWNGKWVIPQRLGIRGVGLHFIQHILLA